MMISSGGKREGEGKKVHHNSNTLYWVKSHFESSMRCYVCCEWVKKFLSFFLEGPDFSPDTPRRGRIWPTPFVRSGAGSWRSLDVEAMTGVTSSRLQRNVTIPSTLPPTLYVPSHPIEASELRWCQEGGKEGADVWHEWQGEETTERERCTSILSCISQSSKTFQAHWPQLTAKKCLRSASSQRQPENKPAHEIMRLSTQTDNKTHTVKAGKNKKKSKNFSWPDWHKNILCISPHFIFHLALMRCLKLLMSAPSFTVRGVM